MTSPAHQNLSVLGVEDLFEDGDGLADKLNELDQRARNWLVGKHAPLWEKHASGKFWLRLQFGACRKPEAGADQIEALDGDVASSVSKLNYNFVNASNLNRERCEPMFVGVVRIRNEVECVPQPEFCEIGLWVRFNSLNEQRFELWIVPTEALKLFGTPEEFLAGGRGFESFSQLFLGLREWEQYAFVSDPCFACEGRHQEVERRSQGVNGIGRHHAIFNGDAYVANQQHAITLWDEGHQVRVFHIGSPAFTEVVSVASSPIEL